MKAALTWRYNSFDELNLTELYAILRVRGFVFVVEQNCPYLDPDDKDQKSFHLCGWDNDKLVAYTRIMPPGLAFEEASIGRVLTSQDIRKQGAGRELMEISIEKTLHQFSVDKIRIGAQIYLQDFYASLGFKKNSDEYMEDGIPHIEMLLKK